MLICILDTEKPYVSQLTRRILQDFPDLAIYGFSGLSPLCDALQGKKQRPIVILYNSSEFPDLIDALHAHFQEGPFDTWSFWPMVTDSAKTEVSQIQFRRLGQMSELLAALADWRKQAKAPLSVTLGQPDDACAAPDANAMESCAVPESSKAYPPLSQSSLWFILNLQTDPQTFAWRRMHEHIRGQGCRLIYLPIMPTYLMRRIDVPNQGPNLSDLLLRLIGDAAKPSAAGHYWQMHPQGWLHFRPPLRSDDLLTCDAVTFRKLASFLRESMHHVGEPTCFVIECQALPFHLAFPMAAAADFCQVALPRKDGYARQSARQESNRFLNELPSSCRIIWPHESEVS